MFRVKSVTGLDATRSAVEDLREVYETLMEMTNFIEEEIDFLLNKIEKEGIELPSSFYNYYLQGKEKIKDAFLKVKEAYEKLRYL